MNELKRIVEDIQSVFAENSYPQEFLDAYDQMECLANHSGREAFLVRNKQTGQMAVAKCYDRAVFPFQPNLDFLRDLEHPGLPRYFEQYRNEQMLCIVREYIEGETLSDCVREHPLTQEQILSCAEQLCEILSVLHGHVPPIIHRDIKPENIIVKPDGTIVLIDFDISRSYKENAQADTVFFGTKGYAPPEQYGFGQTDQRTDLYAFGVLLRWMVTGSTRENPNITINPDLQKIIDRCTAFSPENRYADAQAVLHALKGVRNRKQSFSVTKWLLVTAMLLAALGLGFLLGRMTDVPDVASPVTFQEPLLEKAVRESLGKKTGMLTEDDLSQVTCLWIYGNEAYNSADLYSKQFVEDHDVGALQNLEDLKQLPGLQQIFIGRQGKLDISALAELQRVHTVELKHCRIDGVSPIAAIRSLKYAVLFDCGLSDVTELEACPFLETLDVGLNDLKDLSKVGSYPYVKSLGFMWLDMKNVDDLYERMPKLQTITLQHSGIQDLSGLKKLPDLRTVYVLENQAAEVEKLFQGTDVNIVITEN